MSRCIFSDAGQKPLSVPNVRFCIPRTHVASSSHMKENIFIIIYEVCLLKLNLLQTKWRFELWNLYGHDFERFNACNELTFDRTVDRYSLLLAVTLAFSLLSLSQYIYIFCWPIANWYFPLLLSKCDDSLLKITINHIISNSNEDKYLAKKSKSAIQQLHYTFSTDAFYISG